MYNLEKAIKRFVIVIWVPGFAVTLLLSMVLGPFVWVFTGQWPMPWLFEHAEPFQMAEDWGLIHN